MSVTVFIQGRNGATRWQPGKRWLLLPVLLIAAGTGLYQHNAKQIQQQQASVDNERVAREEQKNELIELKGATESQLAILVTHVAKMQAKLARLEALGQQVAKDYKLEDQFDFSSEVGVGGLSELGSNIELDQLIQDMDRLVSRIDNNNVQLSLLETVTSNLHIDEERYISGRPIQKGWLSSPYGLRNDPFNGRRTMHKGIDFAGKEGADVVATAGGVVTWAGNMFGYGELVEIDHGNGLRTRYGHNKSLSVAVGDVVAKGESIAKMGSTGRSTGPHVHYEVLRGGQQIDPKKYVYRKAG
ncbi:M23 family metallopeptidase [Shewanella loihica]|uniref:Peptidase M23B n=1 Tax=Shewanella loihica (strain ATCC BAA-1088 / PV-4) TaxID=323850 RepID=A3QIL4_SHELP|nr:MULTISPECIES: M23 family metallopeptidase [Shewanella]ABO25312.1 peptidase M23B [Shewanella loihica PV-4]QYJ82082.1 M23 family metallopeptidase [Shewanella aegiceratis]QYJ89623.1 M23 family metallopeptidase [Shewanella halotolerans]QYJ93420.1 M23 family metallopeptidase [Shewanella spartinae]QYJ97306.1 M23 family metallopeptidase [Shewanella alkalitolerans]